MAFLTDPRPGFDRFIRFLNLHFVPFSVFLYLLGIIYFLAIAHSSINDATYFSENALLPGLVQGEFNEDMAVKHFHSELKEVMKNSDSLPVDWLIQKFNSMNIDAYTHNFSLKYPYSVNTVFEGTNIYGIIKAPRSSSSEGLILTAPFRPPDSPHKDTSVSLALILAMAKFCRRQKYWAKDIVFLITEHDQLGTQAWLEAYHNIQLGSGILNYGDIVTRAGSIQAAINLEFHSTKISHIDVKVEGLNGQLPNLDLVNLVHKLCKLEGIRHTFKNRGNPRRRDTPYKQWLHSFITMGNMVMTQASCVPNGNHGLYHRFGIEAVTLEGYEPPANTKKQVAGLFQVGRVLEGILRSLNNLLERFHQSYFFYLLPTCDRFVAIGTYIPSIILIGLPLALKGLTLWLKVFDVGGHGNKMKELKEKIKREMGKKNLKDEKSSEASESKVAKKDEVTNEGEEDKSLKSDKGDKKSDKRTGVTVQKKVSENDPEGIRLSRLTVFLFLSHNIGILFADPVVDVVNLCNGLGLSSKHMIYLIKMCLFIVSPYISYLFHFNRKELDFLNIFALLELVTFFLIFAMHNFSFAFVLSVIYIPCVIYIRAKLTSTKKYMLMTVMLLVNPYMLIHVLVLIYTYVTQGPDDLFYMAFFATQQFFMFLTVDEMVYGNWFLMAIFGILLPNWLVFWTTLVG